MNFVDDQTEQEIFNALISRETTFKIKCIEFKENLIEGTEKERTRLCKKRAKELNKILISNC